MKRQPKTKKQAPGRKQQESVFQEAWENMSRDMDRLLPGFFAKRIKSREGKLRVMVIVTVIELLIIGVVGKLLYDWLAG